MDHHLHKVSKEVNMGFLFFEHVSHYSCVAIEVNRAGIAMFVKLSILFTVHI